MAIRRLDFQSTGGGGGAAMTRAKLEVRPARLAGTSI